MKIKNRTLHFDILRGLAISLMIMANCVAPVYSAMPPLWMRLIGSLAAPSFMILAGMMLALTSKPKPMRGLSLIAIGALIDLLLWRIVPFMTCDVLYTIGIGIMVTAYPARTLSIKTLWGMGVLFLVIGQGLQAVFGYNKAIFNIYLTPKEAVPPVLDIFKHIAHQYFVDGWFPLFPWLGFIWLGAALQRSLQAQTEGFRSPYDNRLLMPLEWMLFAAVSLICSAAYWSLTFKLPEPRLGYSELFYAPTAGFCFTAISVFVVTLLIVQLILRWRFIRFLLAPFGSLGQQSMWIYVVHLVVIEYVMVPYFTTANLFQFWFNALTLWVFCVILARALTVYNHFKQEKIAITLQQAKT